MCIHTFLTCVVCCCGYFFYSVNEHTYLVHSAGIKKMNIFLEWMCLTALDLLYIFGFVEAIEVKELKLTCVFRHVSSVPSHCQKNDIPSTM